MKLWVMVNGLAVQQFMTTQELPSTGMDIAHYSHGHMRAPHSAHTHRHTERLHATCASQTVH
jgi:hypothetical protein